MVNRTLRIHWFRILIKYRMRCSTISFLIVLLFAGTTGFAQIEKHSFGAGLSNGVIKLPNPDLHIYAFGIQGSFINSSKKWIAWKTNLNLGISSIASIERDNFISRFFYFGGDLGFGPMFTYQKKDFGFYLGGTLDVFYMGVRRKLVSQGERTITSSNTILPPFPLPGATAHLGYWQRIGNVNSPWYLEILFTRRTVSDSLLDIFDRSRIYYVSSAFHNLTVGFRYEIRN